MKIEGNYKKVPGLLSLGLSIVYFLLMSCKAPSSPQRIRVQVEQVVSGQTIEVVSSDPQNPRQRVRLIGLDAPDLEQEPWGSVARQRLEEMIYGQAVAADAPPPIVFLELDIELKDKANRLLAYVWQNNQLLNEQLVAAGYALAVSRSPNIKYDKRLAHAQEKARILGLGIWDPNQPMRQTPAEFRQDNR